MSYIIIVRNPRTKSLMAVTSGDDDGRIIAEFETETDAIAAADNTMICKAWPYHFIEVPE